FDRLPIPFRCVAIDLITGRQVVLGHGSLARAMRASMAIPTVFSPVAWGDSLLVDGGTVNNLPVDVALEMGAEVIVAVDVSKIRERQQLDSALAVMGQWFTVADYERRRLNIENANVLIRPDISEFTMLDFSPERIREIIRRGEAAAREFLPELLALQSAHGLYPESGETVRAPGDSLAPPPILAEVTITGARSIGSDTIRRLLGLETGDELVVEDLNRRIDEMYSLGYFEQIQYELTPNAGSSGQTGEQAGEQIGTQTPVDLRVTVKELPLQQLRLGLRYDDVHQLVVAVSALASNLPLPGLHLENELLCGGQIRISGKAFLQSRTLDFPLYPLLNVDYRNIATPLFSESGAEVAEYQDRATRVNAGLGLVLFKSFNAELLYQHEYLDTELGPGPANVAAMIESRDRLRQIRTTVTIDTLDDVLLPKHGILLQGEFETSDRRLDTSRTYELASLAVDWYLTLHPRHTIRFYGFRGATAGGAPAYKSFNQGRHDTFVGALYNQLFASRLSLIRIDYRFRQTEELYLELMANLAPDYEFHQPDGLHTAPGSWGIGIGAKLLTPVGPLELIGARGHLEYEDSPRQQYVLKFRFGYEF
ncbi:MAG: patatin-like phospholipase family protein, partial [bacterium]